MLRFFVYSAYIVTLIIVPVLFLIIRNFDSRNAFDGWISPLSSFYSIIGAFLSILLLYVTSKVKAAVKRSELLSKFSEEKDARLIEIRGLIFSIDRAGKISNSIRSNYAIVILLVWSYSPFFSIKEWISLRVYIFMIHNNIYIKFLMKRALYRALLIYQQGIYERF